MAREELKAEIEREAQRVAEDFQFKKVSEIPKGLSKQNVEIKLNLDSGAFRRAVKGMNKTVGLLGTWHRASSILWAMMMGNEIVARDGTRGVPDELYVSVHERTRLRVRLCDRGRVQHYGIEQVDIPQRPSDHLISSTARDLGSRRQTYSDHNPEAQS